MIDHAKFAAPNPLADEALVDEALVEVVTRLLMRQDHGGDVDGIIALVKAGEPHRGDCTKENFTCFRCQVEGYTKRARAVLALLAKGTETRIE